jgi:polysaccharide export outer membrane protein
MRLPILILITSATLCTAQTYPSNAVPPQTVSIVQNLPQLEIGSNDLLDISVYGSPELSGTLRVGPDGMITLPMAQTQKPIKARGLLPAELAITISHELEDAQLVVHPSVTVKVAEYQSRTVTVVGAVRHPISFQAYGQVTLLDAIGRADGLAETAGDEILVTGGHEPGLTRLTARVNVTSLMAGTNPADNTMLHGGEEVRIPEQGRISVLGDVKHPGVFPVKSQDESSLMMMLARSEGLSPNASANAFIYRNHPGGAPRQEMPVALKRIMDRKDPDIYLEAGDILYIPDNRGRRISLSVLEHLSTIGGATAGALIYSAR